MAGGDAIKGLGLPFETGSPKPQVLQERKAKQQGPKQKPHCECWWPKGSHVAEAKGTDGAQPSQETKPGGEGENRLDRAGRGPRQFTT